MNIVLIGMMGCGKTSIGKKLAKALNRTFYDLDSLIENETGRSISQIFEEDGEAAFRALEADVIKKFAEPQNAVVATGGGAVLNPLNMENLKRGGRVYFINRPPELIIGDVATENRPLLKDGKNRIYELYEQRLALYKTYADVEIINDNSLKDIVSEVCKHENIGD